MTENQSKQGERDIFPESLTSDEEALVRSKVKACRKCWSTGRLGFRSNGDPVLCTCVTKAYTKIIMQRIQANRQEEGLAS